MSDSRAIIGGFVLLLGGILPHVGAASTRPPTVDSLLNAAETVRPVEEGRMRLRVQTLIHGREKPETELDVYVDRDGDWLAVFRSGKQRGRKVLRSSGRLWLLVPGARNPVPVTGQQRMAGTAFLSEVADLRIAREYSATVRKDIESIAGIPCYVLDLSAVRREVPFPSGVLWVGAQDSLPRRLLLRVVSGREARMVAFARYDRILGRDVVQRLEIRDLLRRGGPEVTVVEVLEAEPRELSPALFTPEGARSIL